MLAPPPPRALLPTRSSGADEEESPSAASARAAPALVPLSLKGVPSLPMPTTSAFDVTTATSFGDDARAEFFG